MCVFTHLQSWGCLQYVAWYTGVYLTFTTGRKIWKTVSHIDFQTVYMYVHVDPLENSRQNEGNRRWFSPPAGF